MTNKTERAMLNIITPAGIAVWPKLNTPDEYKGKFTFNTKLVIDPEEDGLVNKQPRNLIEAAHERRDELLAKTRAELLEQAAEAKAAKKGAKAKELAEKAASLEAVDFGKPETDEETGEETGKLVISAKTNATYKDKKGVERDRKVTIFDARGKKLAEAPQIGSGSTLKVAASMVPYYMPKDNIVGVTLYLDAVQIIDLVTFGGGRSAEAYGFGEEDGYTTEDESFGETSGGNNEDAGDGSTF